MTARTMAVDVAGHADGIDVRVCGWRRDRPDGMVEVVDSTGAAVVRAVGALADVRPGDAIEVEGTTTPTGIRPSTVQSWRGDLSAAEPASRSYLRFRDPRQVDVLRQVARLAGVARTYLSDHHFVEVDTPVLWRSTAEYGEEELRIAGPDGSTSAWLQQSPTVPAMLCAVGGIDRAFQFARCFRTEAGESPWKAYEFTQLNLAVTFTSVEEQLQLLEGMFVALASELGITWRAPFPVLTHDECVRRYGNDVPDFRYARFPTPILNGELVGRAEDRVRVLILDECPPTVRRGIERVAVRHWGAAAALAYVDDPTSARKLRGALGDDAPDPDRPLTVVSTPAGARADRFVTALAAAVHGLIAGQEPDNPGSVWIRWQPYLDVEATARRAHRSRCLFGRRIDGDPETGGAADSYDLVVNGVEILSGSQNEVDARTLEGNLVLAGVADPRGAYGYYLDALRLGAPPLHNTSVGWERLTAVLLGVPMSDVMVLPKSGSGRCAVTNLPPH